MGSLLNTFLEKLSMIYHDEIDTSYDVPTYYDGEYYAHRMMRENKLYRTEIEQIIGKFNDYYDKTKDILYLTGNTLHGRTAVSIAVACHEVGHVAAMKNGFTEECFEAEQEATKIALEFMKRKLKENEYAVAERFLNNMLKTYR